MANKKVSQLTSKPSVLVTDLFPIADPSTGQLYKTTISDLGTAIGSGVSSVNTLVGAVVLDTDDIQELASPTNKWFTDTRARAALSASSPLAYNSGTGVFSIPAATSSQNGYLTSTDWSTFNGKLDPSTAASTYVPYTGATGAVNLGSNNITAGIAIVNQVKAVGSGGLSINSNNGTQIANLGGGGGANMTLYGGLSGTSISLSSTLTASSIIKSGGTSSQFLKADGSVDTSTYALDSAVVHNTGNETVAGQKTFSSTLYGAGAVFSSALNAQSLNITGITASPSVYITTNGTNHAVSIVQSGTGYAIYASGNVAVIGTGYFSSSLTASSLSSTAGYNYTLPSASGTLALTSNLSSYLPLSGGTLTGALSGTSATFSSTITSSRNDNGNISMTLSNAYINQGNLINFVHNSGGSTTNGYIGHGGDSSGNIVIINNGITALSLARATGAATFSSNVTATNGTFYVGDSVNGTYFLGGSGNTARQLKFSTSTTTNVGDTHTIDAQSGSGVINFAITSAIKMTIANNGNVGIGTTAPGSALEIARASGTASYAAITSASTSLLVGVDSSAMPRIFVGSSDPITFWTNSTERMRITSGGYTKATNYGSYWYTGNMHSFDQSISEWTAAFVNYQNSGGNYGIVITYPRQSPNNTGSEFIYCTDSITSRFVVRANGGIANYQSNNVNLSDERTKKEISPLESYWNKFKALEIVKFKYKDQTHEDFNIGVIAQQVESVAPEFVDIDGWERESTYETPLKSIYTADLYHASIGVLKEAMAKIETLEAKIKTLENK
jgi:hypothetical protein